MHGNVYEWCQNWYDTDYDENSAAVDPTGPSTGSFRVFRGGSWSVNPGRCRSAFRPGDPPDRRNNLLGFRVALDPAE